MTFTNVFIAGLLQKPINGSTNPKEAKELTGGGLSRNLTPAPSYYQIERVHLAKPARNRCPALPVGCARPWHRRNGDDHRLCGQHDRRARQHVCSAQLDQNDLCAVHLIQGI